MGWSRNPQGLTSEEQERLDSLPKLHFGVLSKDTFAIGTDSANPSYFNSIDLAGTSEGFELITGPDSRVWVKNVSDRMIPAMVGTVNFQPNKGGGGTTLLRLFSESTLDDGVTAFLNPDSLRDIEISNSGETFKTAVSAIALVQPGQAFSFAAFTSSGGSLSFESPSVSVNSPPETVDGLSFFWELKEL